MSDALLHYIRRTLPEELQLQLLGKLDELEQGRYAALLSHPVTQHLLLHDIALRSSHEHGKDADWSLCSNNISRSISDIEAGHLPDWVPDGWTTSHCLHFFLYCAIAALQAFLQANVTGPPLDFSPATVLFPETSLREPQHRNKHKNELLEFLNVDGEAAYKLTPHLELLCLARAIVDHEAYTKERSRDTYGLQYVPWLKLRVDFVHQKVLSEVSPSLQSSLYDGLDIVDSMLGPTSGLDDLLPALKVEEAAIHIHHGLDKQAREVLDEAAKLRRFQFALTGILGKRTRYQEKDTSQLVVLAKSHDESLIGHTNGSSTNGKGEQDGETTIQPQNLDLNDDTVLESIAFSPKPASAPAVTESSNLPAALLDLDPSKQPLLHPIDSALLLALASSITNTRPDEGLTREETLPYAQRVLDGGSSNWQVYTQALLVRSRIEAHRSRTTERGLLQLQTLVDQVIAETTEAPRVDTWNGTTEATEAPAIHINGDSTGTGQKASTFLPRAQTSDSAPASQRLAYLPLLNSPFRWSLEAELAARWTSLGGLRSALEIYERLEMWAETALCWAATEREDKATRIIRRLLYDPSNADDEDFVGELKDPQPSDAPRLHCILADFSTDPETKIHHLKLAWDISKNRYARAQRSLGRLYYSQKDFKAAAAAYSKSLKVNGLNGEGWFAMGCALLELEEWNTATEAFARVVKLDESDAEGWSNLAAALLRGYEMQQPSSTPTASTSTSTFTPAVTLADDDGDDNATQGALHPTDPQQPLKTALTALKRAAQLKHDSALIWTNVLTVCMTLSPPAYLDALVAQRRIIDLRGKRDGENCIDVGVCESVAREVLGLPHTTTTTTVGGVDGDGEGKQITNPVLERGIPRLFLAMLDECVVPLVTASARLWRLVSRVRLWQGRLGEAIEAMEKGWRCAVTAPVSAGGKKDTRGAGLSVPTRSVDGSANAGGEGEAGNATYEEGNEAHWDEVVEATIELVDGYESLGVRTDDAGVEVLPDWKFKARSAIRGVMGKGRELYSEHEGYERLKERLAELRN